MAAVTSSGYFYACSRVVGRTSTAGDIYSHRPQRDLIHVFISATNTETGGRGRQENVISSASLFLPQAAIFDPPSWISQLHERESSEFPGKSFGIPQKTTGVSHTQTRKRSSWASILKREENLPHHRGTMAVEWAHFWNSVIPIH